MTNELLSRRTAGLVLLASTVTACGPAAGKPAVLPDDMAMGEPKAKIKVVEYASVACPVCGHWYREVFPAFKAKYIDTRRVYFVSREMLVGSTGEVAAAAAGFLLARCAGKGRYFQVTDAVYRTQDALFQDPRGQLLKIARSFGFSEAQFTACVEDEKALTALNDRVAANAKIDGVNSTPTFVINGVSMEPGYHALAEIDAAIARARPAR